MTSQAFQIHLMQVNPMVGAIQDNLAMILAQMQQTCAQPGSRIMVYPELVLTGYPPEDLLLRHDFIDQVEAAVEQLQATSREYADLVLVVGAPWRRQDGTLVNAALAIHAGAILAVHHKLELPNYRVFDEKRYFFPSEQPTATFAWQGCTFGLSVCEDIWFPRVTASAVSQRVQVLLNLNASPFHVAKDLSRRAVLQSRLDEAQALSQPMTFVYVNQVGGQDELVFDGGSMVLTAAGHFFELPGFVQDEGIFALDPIEMACSQIHLNPLVPWHQHLDRQELEMHQIYQALVVGTRDYIKKNGFNKVFLGLSGGIDSALTLALAVAAVGSDAVTAVMMPFTYTAAISQEDAEQQALTLGVNYLVRPIAGIYEAINQALADDFTDLATDTTEENIQARCRGILLMALANKFGGLVLTTGNKSELAVGYSTLYGDMAGGFDPIKDLPKMQVYALAAFINRYAAELGFEINSSHTVIPQRVIDRPPSAELREDQKDQDSLPAYEILDGILYRFIELDQSPADIIAEGFDEVVVNDIVRRVKLNEHKRRQAPPGVRISTRAFGRDRRYPITARW